VQHRPFGLGLGFFPHQPLAAFTFGNRFTPGALGQRV